MGSCSVNRVKWHTDFSGKIESGLFKMMAIGLGKFAGAQRYHTYAYKLGLETIIRTVGRQVWRPGRCWAAAILEDANHNTAQLTAVPVQEMEHRKKNCSPRSRLGWAEFLLTSTSSSWMRSVRTSAEREWTPKS